MKKFLFSLSLLFCISLSSYSQDGDGCCPDYNANLTVVGCSLEVCFTAASKKKTCQNASFFVQIHNQDGDLVYSGVQNGFCFTFEDTAPGDTYTVSGTISPDPTPIECFPPAQILPSSVTVPEDCSCCPTLSLTTDVNDCDFIVCWEIENPDVEYCPEGTVIQLFFEQVDGFQQVILEFGPGDDCFTWPDAIPGATYNIGIRAIRDFDCNDPDGTIITETMPEDCGCCPDLVSTVDIDSCDAIICVSPLNDGEDFCENGFNSILAFIRDDQGNIIDVITLTDDNCFVWSGGEPGQTYTVGGRIDYEYDCDDSGNDLVPVEFTIPEDCGNTECSAPWNIECHPLNNDISLTWEGPENAVEYFVEIRSHVEGVSCCEPHENIVEVTFSTTQPTIKSVKEAASFNCLVMRITTICEDGSSETTDWICFSLGYWHCPEGLKSNNTSELDVRNSADILNDLIAYPNPVTDVLNLEGENLQLGYSVSIFSFKGEFISKEFITKKNFYQKDMNRLTAGQYIAKIYSSDGTPVEQVKFIKI